MVYRVSKLTYLLGRSRVKVPHFAMVNLIAGKEIVPELVQHDFTVTKVVTHLREILPDGQPRNQMLEGLASVRKLLQGTNADHLHPAERAAEVILKLLQQTTVET
jgi:lipid-A-disaccharide synthase